MVTGIIDEPAKLTPALDALRSAGFADAAVEVERGEEGLADVDPDGSRHGLIGRLVRTLQQIGEEGEEWRAAAEELRAGHAVVGVSVDGAEEKERAAATLHQQGAHRIRYWGQWEIEELST